MHWVSKQIQLMQLMQLQVEQWNQDRTQDTHKQDRYPRKYSNPINNVKQNLTKAYLQLNCVY